MKTQKSFASSSSNSQTPEASGIRASKVSGETTRQVSQKFTIPEPKFEKGSRSSAAKPKKRSRDYSKFGIQVPNTKKDARKSWSPEKITLRREKGLDDRIPQPG